jgi:trigger factor
LGAEEESGWAVTERHGIVTGVPTAVTRNVKTTVTELPDSRVRVQVEVPPDEVEGRVEQRARQLGRQLKLPGFRKGKVPAPLVLQRVGREAVLDEAVRDSLASWYSDAIVTAGIVPVGDPKVDLGDLPPQGQALEFSIEIGVLPKAELGEYEGLDVARRQATAADELIEQEVEAMRERLARSDTVEREAGDGDYVVVDYVGYLSPEDPSSGEAAEPFEGGEGRDQLV